MLQVFFLFCRGNVAEQKLDMYMAEQKRRDEERRKQDEEKDKKNEAYLKTLIDLISKQKPKAKGKVSKGKGKKLSSLSVEPTQSTSTGLLQNIRSVFSGSQSNLQGPVLPNNDADTRSHHSSSSFSVIDDDQHSVSSHQDPVMPPPQPLPPRPSSPRQPQVQQNLIGGDTKSVFITKCALLLNNQELDQFESKQTVDQAISDYSRLFLTCGLANSLQSNFISYSNFLGGTFISAWDLSTSGFVGNSYALPNIKTGIHC